MSFTQIYYHIIFSTKNRENVLLHSHERELYNYLWGILKNKKCYAYRIGGVEDHIHLLISMPTTICLSDLIRELKVFSGAWIKKNNIFPGFCGWQSEYAVFTKSHADCDVVTRYIKSQREHHKNETGYDELLKLLKKEGVKFDERYVK